jgi:ubiquinone/menaquinone biosynthesis C-methylase UbiE
MNDNFAHRAADWDSPAKIEMTEIFVAEMMHHIKPNKNWKALEIGAGTGLVGLQILPYIGEIVFEDISAAMLEVLKSKLIGLEPVEMLHGEVFDYRRQDIDLIFSCMAFHHIPKIEETLKHLYKITTPGALIVVGDIRSEDGSFHRFEPIPHRGFDTGLLSEQFRDAGFEVLVLRTYNVLTRERVKGKLTGYEQFILVAKKR